MDAPRTRRFCSCILFAAMLVTSLLPSRPATAGTPAEILADVPAQVVDSGGLRAVDRDAYFELLHWTQSADLEALRREAEVWSRERRRIHDETTPAFRYSQFADVLANPDAWQGKPIRIVGHANRVVTYSPGPHPLGIGSVYESWVVTDSSQRFPVVVVTRNVPKETPIGEEEVTGVDATGIFFQLFTYRARDGRGRIAPLVIADSWQRPQPPEASVQQHLLVLLAALFGVTASLTILSILKRSRRARRSFASPQLDFADLTGRQADPSPGEPNDRDKSASNE